MSTIVHQCRCGLEKIINNFNKTSKIHLSGHSSGGHKVAMLLASDWSTRTSDFLRGKLGHVTVLCGVYELGHLIGTEVDIPLKMSE